MKNENTRLIVNRVVSFLVGGLFVFAVMSFTVVSTANKTNAELTRTLDTSRYEAGRLLSDAKAQFAARDYAKAKSSVASLLMNQPGSAEAKEAQILLPAIESAAKAVEVKWEAEVASVRQKWADSMAAEIREKSDKARTQLEKDMKDTIDREWERAKDNVRAEWEKQG